MAVTAFRSCCYFCRLLSVLFHPHPCPRSGTTTACRAEAPLYEPRIEVASAGPVTRTMLVGNEVLHIRQRCVSSRLPHDHLFLTSSAGLPLVSLVCRLSSRTRTLLAGRVHRLRRHLSPVSMLRRQYRSVGQGRSCRLRTARRRRRHVCVAAAAATPTSLTVLTFR